jgi:hypothetical protein
MYGNFTGTAIVTATGYLNDTTEKVSGNAAGSLFLHNSISNTIYYLCNRAAF